MSLIAYANGMLVADNTALREDCVGILHPMQKLFISPTKQFAYAYCGSRIHSRAMEKVHDDLHTALLEAYRTNMNPSLDKEGPPGPHGEMSVTKQTTFLIITRDRVYQSRGFGPFMEELELSDVVARGTNASAYITARLYRDTEYEAALTACEYIMQRPCSINVCAMHELEPIQFTETVKG